MKTRSRKPLLLKSNEQYCLDFGQKNYDPIRCETCGMLYTVGEETDEKQHAKYHAEFDNGVKWQVKLERPKKYYDDGCRVIDILRSDPKPILDAVSKVLKMSYTDMAAEEDITRLMTKNKAVKFYIFVNQSNNILGYICAEKISEAFVLLDFDASRMESDPVVANCGILFLWVHPMYRRQYIGSKLTDVARANITFSKIVSRSRVAVCDPTPLAIPFFNGYLKNKRPIKVYQKELS